MDMLRHMLHANAHANVNANANANITFQRRLAVTSVPDTLLTVQSLPPDRILGPTHAAVFVNSTFLKEKLCW